MYGPCFCRLKAMDLFLYLIYFILFSVSLVIILLAFRHKSTSTNLPPGRKGWPVIGETLEFAFTAQRGKPEKFIKDRMNKYSPKVFRTSLMGENMAVMCGASGNKFLFSNEDKLVTSWWPNLIKKILYFPSLLNDASTRDLTKPHRALLQFLKQYVEIMDLMARKHIDMDWAPNKEVKVYMLSKKYTFALSCRLFLKIEDSEWVARISNDFDHIMAGFISLPIDIPGTTFNRAIKAKNILHKELIEIIKKRKKELTEKRDLAAQDLLSHMLLVPDENGKVLNEMEISTYILGVLLASHETTSTAITFVLKYLSEFPDVYDAVLKGTNPSKPA